MLTKEYSIFFPFSVNLNTFEMESTQSNCKIVARSQMLTNVKRFCAHPSHSKPNLSINLDCFELVVLVV